MDNEATAVETVEQAPAPEAQTESAAPAELEPTSRGAIDRAFDAIDKADSKPVEAAKPADTPISEETATGERERNADGTFKAKEQAEGEETTAQAVPDDPSKPNYSDAPSRFSADAKAAWKDAPQSVKSEIHRMESELTAGIQKYQQEVQQFDEFRPFAEELKQTGQRFTDVVENYRGIENMLANNPIQGLDTICRNLGTDLQSVAAHVLNQTPDQSAQHQNNIIHELRQELSGLKQQLGGVTQTLTSQAEKSVQSQINEFAQTHPRLEELGSDVAFFLQNGRAQDLQEAYSLAERLNPAPQAQAPVSAQAAAITPDAAQPRKGQLSVTGAPGNGSNPASKKAPSSARDALDNAFASVGLS